MKKLFKAALVVLCLAGIACAKGPVVENEKYVALHYRGTLNDGSEFDSSLGGEPLEFIYGVGMMIPGFEAGVAGMRSGQKKTFTVRAADAYGDYDPEMLFPVPREYFPDDFNFQIGVQLFLQTEVGPLPARIMEITDTEIFVDCNPPFAGEDLIFEVEILEVRDLSDEERMYLLP